MPSLLKRTSKNPVAPRDKVPEVLILSEGMTAEFTVGRKSSNRAVMDCAHLPQLCSRKHCTLKPHGDTWAVHDSGSLNGTWINGRRMQQDEGPTPLKDCDRVSFGGLRFVSDRPNPFVYVFIKDADASLLASAGALERDAGAQHGGQQSLEMPATQSAPQELATEGGAPQVQAHPCVPGGEAADALPEPRPQDAAGSSAAPAAPLGGESETGAAGGGDGSAPSAGGAGELAARRGTKRNAPDADNAVTEEFECVVCRDTILKAHLLSCGHMFCCDCVHSWLLKSRTCPTCRAPTKCAPIPSMAVDNVIARTIEGKLTDGDRQARAKRLESFEARARTAAKRVKADRENGVVMAVPTMGGSSMMDMLTRSAQQTARRYQQAQAVRAPRRSSPRGNQGITRPRRAQPQ